MMWWNGGNWGWGIGLLFFPVIIFGGGVISLGIWLISRLIRGGRIGGGSSENSYHMDIVKERYARGEITKEQFDQIKKDLS